MTFSDTTGLNGFGLQGFFIDLNGDFRTAGNNGPFAINEIGTHVFNLIAGTAYTFTIYSNANISGGLPAGTASNAGLFTFTVTPAAVPAPPAAVLALVGAVTAVGGRRLRRSA